VNIRDRESLVARIRQIRRVAAPPEAPERSAQTDPLKALEIRVAHLEHMLQGLQDSVHREAGRQNKRITDLEARLQPAALGKALTEDARERGL
jgi:hypothetical protein